MGEHWDDDISIKPIIWSSVAIVAAVAFAFGICWVLMGPPLDYFQDKYWGMEPDLSPLAEANEQRKPPTPWLQSSPEMELDAMLEEQQEHNESYGWNDPLSGVVHIPLDRALELVASSLESAPAAVEPAEEDPVDVDSTPSESEDGAAQGETDTHEAAEPGEAHG